MPGAMSDARIGCLLLAQKVYLEMHSFIAGGEEVAVDARPAAKRISANDSALLHSRRV